MSLCGFHLNHHFRAGDLFLLGILDPVIVLGIYTDFNVVLQFFVAQANDSLHMYSSGKLIHLYFLPTYFTRTISGFVLKKNDLETFSFDK